MDRKPPNRGSHCVADNIPQSPAATARMPPSPAVESSREREKRNRRARSAPPLARGLLQPKAPDLPSALATPASLCCSIGAALPRVVAPQADKRFLLPPSSCLRLCRGSAPVSPAQASLASVAACRSVRERQGGRENTRRRDERKRSAGCELAASCCCFYIQFISSIKYFCVFLLYIF